MSDIVKLFREFCPYMSIDDGHTLIKNLTLRSVNDTNFYHLGLDIIFPAIDHLKLYLSDADMGSIAMVSKKLYQLITSHYTAFQVELFITEYNILHADSYAKINIEFYINGQKILVPIPSKTIPIRKLRILLGPELFFKREYDYIFFTEDIIYKLKKYDFCYDIYINTLVCVFCRKVKDINDDHELCLDTFIQTHICTSCKTIKCGDHDHSGCVSVENSVRILMEP